MENSSRLFAGAQQGAGRLDSFSQLREDWRVARSAHLDLDLRQMPGVNLLLIGREGAVQDLLELLTPDLGAPIANWRAGERLTLPEPSSRGGTMMLRGVSALKVEEQRRLIAWLDRIMGRVQVVSTSSVPLFPLVQARAFSDTLYYRLNTFCVDLDS
jgi:hypothetical protein